MFNNTLKETMIHFNTEAGSKERQETKPLTLDEEYQVVETLNYMLAGNRIVSEGTKDLLQRFINHYQNLNHYRAYTEGLYATDRKELAQHKDFFQIKF